MPRLYFIRNGRTEEGVGFIENPRLDEVGHIQAEAVANLLGALPRMAIYSSPQRRAMETAEPLAKRWYVTPVADENLTLMPVPDEGKDENARKKRLSAFMDGSWQNAPAPQAQWRDIFLSKLKGLEKNTVVVSHFVVINAAVGAATGDDRTTVFNPDNGSITILDNENGELKLVKLGRQAATRKM